MSIRPGELKQLAQKAAALLLSVRPKTDHSAYPETIPGASRQSPAQVDAWVQEISKGYRGVIYGIG
jgi:hypothetical protein